MFSHGTFQRYVLCFLLDSFELQEMVCLTKYGATFSSLNISRRAYCSGYDEHGCNTIIFFLMLETEGSISETDNHHFLLEASELRSCKLQFKLERFVDVVSVDNFIAKQDTKRFETLHTKKFGFSN